MRFLALALVLFMALGANMPENMIARVGIEPNFLLAGLMAVAISGMVAHRHILLVILVIVTCVGANLSAEYAQQLGINRDYLMATLVAVVLLPVILKLFDWDD